MNRRNGHRNGGGRPAVPPNGFDGAAQQTPANLAAMSAAPPVGLWATAARSSGSRGAPLRRKRRRKAAKRAAPSKRRTRRAKKSRRHARLVKGSAAAKRFMARLRAKRKK